MFFKYQNHPSKLNESANIWKKEEELKKKNRIFFFYLHIKLILLLVTSNIYTRLARRFGASNIFILFFFGDVLLNAVSDSF